VTSPARTAIDNAAWEVTRLRRSRRIWLLIIPVVAGPVGSLAADLYLHVPSVATAQVLGLLITGGLSALVLLDLTALAVGEDLALRTQLLTFALPQGRSSALAGRLLIVTGGTLGSYALGGGAAALVAAELVRTTSSTAPILSPVHLYLGLFGLLMFLGGVVAAAALVTRSASQALVAGVLAGVLAAGIASSFLLQHQLGAAFPVALAGIGVAAWGWAVVEYGRIDS
jgi:ABC-type transport system involved in multi-copper enzyme maturation permease subunit